MFEKECKKITISGKEFPIKFDNYVLAMMQEFYGTIHEFELKIKGFRQVLDEKGEPATDEWNKPILNRTEPNIKALNDAIVCMIDEGLRIEDIKQTYKRSELIAMIDIPYMELADIVQTEYNKCFETKK